MSDHRLRLERVLTPAEYAAIDAFGAAHRGVPALPAIARFLKDRFDLALDLDPDIVAGFATDSSNLPGSAQGLCRPASAREAAIVFRACFTAGIPVTVSGGKSNLTGSATPEGGVLVSTVKLVEVAPGTPVRVDAAARTVQCPVGMILEDMRNAVLAQSHNTLAYPVDPTSRADATVGGTIACNASGFIPGARGATRDWVESLDLLLPNGLLIRARRGEAVSRDGVFLLDDGSTVVAWPVPRYPRPAIKNAGGPFSAPDGVMDVLDLVVGSEGLFGLVTACTLRLIEKPSGSLDLFFPLPGEADALALRRHVAAHLKGDLSVLGAFEYFGAHSPQFMDHRDALYGPQDKVGIYLQVPLWNRSVDEAAEEWLGVLADAHCHVEEDSIRLLDNERNWKIFMEARHSLPANALETAKQRGAFTIMTDTAVPPDRFEEFLAFTHAAICAKSLDYVSFGHFGDCHLHFTILPHPPQSEAAVAVYDAIVAKSADLGGVYSGEHGTGKRKRKDFLRGYGPDAVAQVRRCKAAVDPEFLLNRGNVVEPPKA